MTFTIPDIIEITKALQHGHCEQPLVQEFLFDSRSLATPGHVMFVALRTPSGDGHKHIWPLYNRGVRMFLVEEVPANAPAMMPGAVFLQVSSVYAALEALAAAARARLKGRVVAITGSQGKTVVKEMLYSAFPDKVWRSPRSWNSQLGVPMALLEADEDAPVTVFEAGIDAPGQMQCLSRLLQPHIAVFTSLTNEHDSGFSSLAQKRAEKVLLAAGATAVMYNKSDFGDDFSGREGAVAVNGRDFADTDKKLAQAVADACGLGTVGTAAAARNRLDVRDGINGCMVVYDGFTNDLRSVRASLDMMRRRADKLHATTVILADMPDGNEADAIALMGIYGVKRVVGVGERASAAALAAGYEACAAAADFPARYSMSDFSYENILIAAGSGPGGMAIKQILESARHDTTLDVDLDALVYNFNRYRSMVPPATGMIAMVKASAYGMGAVEVARTLQAQGAAYLAVAVIDEGVQLRRAGITMPIMVLNPVTTNYKALFDNRLEPSVFSLDELDRLTQEAARAGADAFSAHIKLDTGMHRVGFTQAELPSLIARLKSSPTVKVATVFSHLATADCPDESEYTLQQLSAFETMSSAICRALPYAVKRHILNTAGIMAYPAHHYDYVRLGIGLYGVNPLPGQELSLKTVAALHTTVISLKQWPAGTTIGYGRRGVLQRPSLIATIPVGYADGLNRHLSRGAASFLVNGVAAPVVGNICMDQCMVDVTDVPGVKVGDAVEIFGATQPVTRLADILDTIPYEIFTSVSPRVKRIYHRG